MALEDIGAVVNAVFDKVGAAGNDARGFANYGLSTADDFMRTLGASLSDSLPIVNSNIVVEPGPTMTPPESPTWTAIGGIDTSGKPSPTLEGYNFDPYILGGGIPTPDYGADPGAVPAPNFGTFAGSVAITDIQVPTAPTIIDPGVDPLLVLSAVELPIIDLSPFQSNLIADVESFVGNLLVKPEITPYTEADKYTSALLTQLGTKLSDWLANGGTGIPPHIEQALWDRERDREQTSLVAAERDVAKTDAMTGFAMPTGALAARIDKVRIEALGKIVTASRDVAIKQADLMVQNMRHAIQETLGLESKLLDMDNATKQRTFEACKYATEAGVQVYNALASAARAMTEIYNSEVQAYSAFIGAEVKKIEVYKAEIEAEGIKATVNKSIIEAYTAKINAQVAMISGYKAYVEGLAVQAQIEGLKVKKFEAEIQAYGAKVNAYTAEVGGYHAQAQVYTERVKAYESKVHAYSAEVSARGEAARASVALYSAKAEAFKAEWGGYSAKVGAEGERARAEASVAQAGLAAYTAYTQAVQSHNTATVAEWNYGATNAIKLGETHLAAAKMNADLFSSHRALAVEAAKAGAQVGAQLAGSAMNMVHYGISSQASVGSTASNNTNTNINIKA